MPKLKVLFANSSRLFWLLQISGWLGYLCLSALAAIGHDKPVEYHYVILATAGVGLLITSALRLGYRAIWDWPSPRLALSGIVLLLAATSLYGYVYAELIFQFCLECRPNSLMGYLGYLGSVLYILLSWSGLYFGIKFSRQLQQQTETTLKATAMAHEAQLKMLRYQLNPHFLFNTLNAISTLVLDGDRDTANRMVGSLSAFLRYSLDKDPMQRVTLAQEIECLQLYLGIERVRFGDRLRVHIALTPPAQQALVPTMILQPLIENAIKFAVAKRVEGGAIVIVAAVDKQTLDIRISDDGPGSENFNTSGTPGSGVGLANTRERLRVLFGEGQQFCMRNLPGRGAEAHLRLPFERAI